MNKKQNTNEGKCPKSVKEIIDMYFNDIRSALLETAAFLDRVERVGGKELINEDPRMAKIIEILKLLSSGKKNRAEALLNFLSEPVKDDPESEVKDENN